MPIHEVTLPDGSKGWQWGEHGAKYASREEAERQAAAAHANGWAGDGAAPVAAGVILRSAGNGRLLFLRRAADAHDHPSKWCWPGGGIDEGETPEEAARRELREETGFDFPGPLRQVDERGGFVTFLGDVPEEFEPSLNEEHDDAHWAEAGGLWLISGKGGRYMHPGVLATLQEVDLDAPEPQPTAAADLELGEDSAMSDRIAFDRASARRIDPASGHMHVSSSNISKATVNPYYGQEIPGWKELGLQADKIYQVLRPAEELEKAASTFVGKPLLIVHKAMNADGHDRKVVVGSIGNVEFNFPYLKADLNIWDGEAIALIEAADRGEEGGMKELSCGYGYRPVLQDGSFEGQDFQIVMRDIHGNHATLCEEGRAGPDVLVGDQKPKGQPMKLITRALPSRKALLVQGALSALLAPKLAADAKLDLSATLDGVNRSNFKAKKAAIASSLEKALNGKLAQDEGLGEVVEAVAELLDNIEGVQSGAPDDDDLSADEDETETKSAETKPDGDKPAEAKDEGDLSEKLKAAGLSDEEIAKVCAALKPAQDGETVETKPDAEKPAETKDEGEKFEKAAMDAAIATAVTKAKADARRETIRHLGAISAAKEAVRPHVGELPGAFDSAEEVYKFALDHAIENGVDIDLTGVPASAYAAMVKMLPAPTAKETKHEHQAHDAKGAARAAEMFPGLARIRHA